MAIDYRMEAADGVLFVEAAGFDEHRSEVEAYGLAVIHACREHGIRRVLCDEQALEYRLATLDTFEAAKLIAAQARSVERVALVVNPANIADARFWEDVTRNRGLFARVFLDREAARQWLTT